MRVRGPGGFAAPTAFSRMIWRYGNFVGGDMSEPENGLVTVMSRLPVAEAINRLANKATSLGLRVFARIDHAAGAAQVGMELRPTELLIFGSPKSGTPLMQDHQTAGIELPLKVLAWEDGEGLVHLTYNDPAWLARRHGLGPASHDSLEAIAKALATLTQSATGD
jgi:uncharacterized protein (DUF302 family)